MRAAICTPRRALSRVHWRVLRSQFLEREGFWMLYGRMAVRQAAGVNQQATGADGSLHHFLRLSGLRCKADERSGLWAS